MKTWVTIFFVFAVTLALGQSNLVYLELGGNAGAASFNYERSFQRANNLSFRVGLGISFFEFEEEISSNSMSECIGCGVFSGLPKTSLSIPFSIQYPINLGNNNYLEASVGSTGQISNKSILVQYGSLFFRRHFGENIKWIWKAGLTPILGVVGNNLDKGSEPTIWFGASLGKRF